MPTFQLQPFVKSVDSMLGGTPSILDATLKLVLLDKTAAITEDLTSTGDEFLSDLVGYAILSEVTLVSPAVANALLTIDSSASNDFPDIGAGEVADKILLLSDTGTPATSRVWGIATLSADINGDDVADDLDVPTHLFNFNG